jgi:hypothetical protein
MSTARRPGLRPVIHGVYPSSLNVRHWIADRWLGLNQGKGYVWSNVEHWSMNEWFGLDSADGGGPPGGGSAMAAPHRRSSSRGALSMWSRPTTSGDEASSFCLPWGGAGRCGDDDLSSTRMGNIARVLRYTSDDGEGTNGGGELQRTFLDGRLGMGGSTLV